MIAVLRSQTRRAFQSTKGRRIGIVYAAEGDCPKHPAHGGEATDATSPPTSRLCSSQPRGRSCIKVARRTSLVFGRCRLGSSANVRSAIAQPATRESTSPRVLEQRTTRFGGRAQRQLPPERIHSP